jgi:hypothetical protein
MSDDQNKLRDQFDKERVIFLCSSHNMDKALFYTFIDFVLLGRVPFHTFLDFVLLDKAFFIISTYYLIFKQNIRTFAAELEQLEANRAALHDEKNQFLIDKVCFFNLI